MAKWGCQNALDHPKMNLSKNIIFSTVDDLEKSTQIRTQFRKSPLAPL
jgi:hypothetical protein